MSSFFLMGYFPLIKVQCIVNKGFIFTSIKVSAMMQEVPRVTKSAHYFFSNIYSLNRHTNARANEKTPHQTTKNGLLYYNKNYLITL